MRKETEERFEFHAAPGNATTGKRGGRGVFSFAKGDLLSVLFEQGEEDGGGGTSGTRPGTGGGGEGSPAGLGRGATCRIHTA